MNENIRRGSVRSQVNKKKRKKIEGKEEEGNKREIKRSENRNTSKSFD